MKADISHYFLVFFYFDEEITPNRKDIYFEKKPSVAYDRFIRLFSKAYDTSFTEIQETVKIKSFVSPWITKGIYKNRMKGF